jgi:hypothetical protein
MSATPREWWTIYQAVDTAMSRELGTTPSMIASAVYDALYKDKPKPVCCSTYEEYRAKHEAGS